MLKYVMVHVPYRVVPKGLLTFLGFFMQCRVKSLLGTSKYIQALIHLACLRVFSMTPWIIVYRLYHVRWQGQSDWFSKTTLDPPRMMEYQVSKASTISIITTSTCHQLSIDLFFSLLSMKHDIKILMQLSDGKSDQPSISPFHGFCGYKLMMES